MDVFPLIRSVNDFSFYSTLIAFRGHLDALKAYKEINRQDKEAERTGTVPEYQRTGFVDITPEYLRGSNAQSNNGGSNTQSNNGGSGSSNNTKK